VVISRASSTIAFEGGGGVDVGRFANGLLRSKPELIVLAGAIVGGSLNIVRGVKMFGPALMPYCKSNDEIDKGSLYANGSSSTNGPNKPAEAA